MLVPRMNENNIELKMLKEDRFYQPQIDRERED